MLICDNSTVDWKRVSVEKILLLATYVLLRTYVPEKYKIVPWTIYFFLVFAFIDFLGAMSESEAKAMAVNIVSSSFSEYNSYNLFKIGSLS